MKRMYAMFLAVLLLISVFTACGKNSAGSEESSAAKGEESSETGKMELSERRQITIALSKNELISSFDDNLLTYELEAALNCDIDFQLLSDDDNAIGEIQLMFYQNQELPDIIAFPIGKALTYELGTAGYLTPLNKWYEDPAYAPNFHSVVSEEDKNTMLAAAASADGNIYSMVRYEPDYQSMTPYHLYINTVWLENLGMDIPTTSDELKEVLIAFANEDPNGNGEPDEIPLLTNLTDDSVRGNNAIAALMNMFIYTGPKASSFTLSEDGLQVIAPQLTEEYRDGLRYFHSLQEEGALTENSFTYMGNYDDYRMLLNYSGLAGADASAGESVNIVGMFTANSITEIFPGAATDENKNFLEYQMIPMPAGPTGKAYSPYAAPECTGCWFVTSQAEEPGYCVTMGDSFYHPVVSLMARYGEKDEDWTNDETFCAQWYIDHTIMLEGSGMEQPVKDYYSIVLLRSDAVWGEKTNAFWHNVQPRYVPLEFSEHIVDFYNPDTFVSSNGSYGNITAQVKELYAGEQPEHLLPALQYTAEEQSAITEYEALWPDFPLRVMNECIFGGQGRSETGEVWTVDVNSDEYWDMWLEETELAGVPVMLEAAQAAYERTEQFKELAAAAEG